MTADRTSLGKVIQDAMTAAMARPLDIDVFTGGHPMTENAPLPVVPPAAWDSIATLVKAGVHPNTLRDAYQAARSLTHRGHNPNEAAETVAFVLAITGAGRDNN